MYISIHVDIHKCVYIYIYIYKEGALVPLNCPSRHRDISAGQSTKNKYMSAAARFPAPRQLFELVLPQPRDPGKLGSCSKKNIKQLSPHQLSPQTASTAGFWPPRQLFELNLPCHTSFLGPSSCLHEFSLRHRRGEVGK